MSTATIIPLQVPKPILKCRHLGPEFRYTVEEGSAGSGYGAKITCYLEAGTAYQPRALSHPCSIKVEEGTGLFFYGGLELEYKPGMTFKIRPGIKHCFLRVDTSTTFDRKIPRLENLDLGQAAS